MSSYFHSAAMTLLSKTLQTLLYKYLSDVDVEGVALPSLYNSDGHSGWGVRLSNVKLREGVKLMDLPGRITPKDHKKQETDPMRDTTTTNATKSTTSAAGQKHSTTSAATAAAPSHKTSNLSASSHIDGGNHASLSSFDLPGSVDSVDFLETVVDESEYDQDADDDDNDSSSSSSSDCLEHVEDDDDHSFAVSTQPPSPDAPPAIPKRTSSGWFSWGGYLSQSDDLTHSNAKATATTNATTTATHNARDPVGSKRAHSEELSATHDLSVKEQAVSGPLRSGSLDPASASLGDFHNSNHSANTFASKTPRRRRRRHHHNHHNHRLNQPSVATAEQPPPEQEPSMRLRLGKSGSIGILDVRLVGKDLHVVVEDADLTIEAVVIKSSATEKKEEKDKVPKVKPEKKRPEPETIGDRILASNRLAKILSSIPNLFLRDIRIKLIIRYEPVDEPDKPTEHESPNDTTVELCIELLSVTDGQDFFAHVREEEEEASTDVVGDYEQDEPAQTVAPTINTEGQFTQNEYVTKRIRTGRGPEGGLVLRIFPGEEYIDSRIRDPHWARQAWYASADWCVLRCSGLDLHARIFMGTVKELQFFSGAEAWYGDTQFDEYTVDSMLFGGVDYIAPGPQPPLPPMAENAPFESEEGQLWTLPGATTYRIDANGIQSSFVSSSFHRVARGMRPKTCTHDHLPCEYCDYCWEALPGTPLTHSYDMAAPLGGLVVNLMIRDPLEVNLDRPTLQIIGILLQLFKKPVTNKPSEAAGPVENAANVSDDDQIERQKPLQPSISLHSKASQSSSDATITKLDDSKTMAMKRSQSMPRRSFHATSDEDPDEHTDAMKEFGDIASAFPSYMSPENVQYAGIYIGQIIFRVHMMSGDLSVERGHGFCFWQIVGKCITFDQHHLIGNILPFSDVRLDCGFLTVTSLKGNEQRMLLSLGVRQRVVEFDEATVETFMTRGEECQRPPWPATSTVLLDIPPPLESLVFETRERHAFQIRYVSVLNMNADKTHSSAHVKLGNVNVNMEYASIRDMSTVVREARSTITSQPPPSNPAPRVQPPKPDSLLMRYRLQLEGARVILEPLIDARVPLCSLTGDRSSLSGLCVETVLEKLHVQYGKRYTPTIMDEQRLSLEGLARLPEQLRMRILLCLDDLNPLARALGMRSEENSFLRCRSINKRIVRVANKKKKRPSLRLDEQITRRQFLMQELMKLGDDELEDLYESHMSRQRRYARSQGNL